MSETNTVSPLRQHMIEDMAARKLNPHTQRSYIPWVKVFVPTSEYPPQCPEALENDKRGFVGYMLEYAWVKEERKCMHIYYPAMIRGAAGRLIQRSIARVHIDQRSHG